MACFDDQIVKTLQFEGGYANDPDDPGGETNFGISKRSYPDLDIRFLTRPQAIEIYRRDFWDALHCSVMYCPVASKLFDLAVNMGKVEAVKLLQQAMIALDPTNAKTVHVDGQLGPVTMHAVFLFDPVTLRDALCQQARTFYRQLAERRPVDAKYLDGWLRRADA